MSCKNCGSYAINPYLHGRKPGIDLDLCDVCYWWKRAEDGIRRRRAKKAKFEELGYEEFDPPPLKLL